MTGADTIDLVAAEVLERLARGILVAEGVPAEAAQTVAQSLVLAELRGQPSHGLGRLEVYVKRLRAGLTTRTIEPTLVARTPALSIYDGHDGFGHVIGLRVMDACIETARTMGLGAAAVRNSTHFGIAGVFALRAAAAGMIGIAASNAAPRMPPVGTRTAVLGTNPIAIAVPRSTGGPILLDMATSATALGRIVVARDRGEALPEGWALAKDGRPTTDPTEALAGLILPMAGPKGFGLALALEVLCACLSGSAPGRGAGSLFNTDRSEGLGHFFLAISPAALGTAAAFEASVDELVRQVHEAEPLPGSSGGLVPGEPEARREAQSRQSGVALEPAARASLRRLAEENGVACPL